MAREIGITVGVSAVKGYLSLSRAANYQVDLTGSTYSVVGQTIGTTYEAVTINSDVATAGVFFFRNLDATNFVTIGVVHSAVYVPLIKLKAGEACVGRLATSSVYAQADTAAVVLEATVISD